MKISFNGTLYIKSPQSKLPAKIQEKLEPAQVLTDDYNGCSAYVFTRGQSKEEDKALLALKRQMLHYHTDFEYKEHDKYNKNFMDTITKYDMWGTDYVSMGDEGD